MKVTYVGNPYKGPINGIVKTMHPRLKAAWIVYDCVDWGNYQDYTGNLTLFSELLPGWNQDIEEHTETVTIDKKRDGYEITVQHDQSGSAYGMDVSRAVLIQLYDEIEKILNP